MTPRIFVGSSFPEEAETVLARGLAAFDVVRPEAPLASNLVPQGDQGPIDADVVFGQPSIPAIEASPRLRWIHLTSAGYTRYAEADARALLASRKIDLTTSSSVYAEPCATHALTLVLALLRRLDGAAADRYGGRVWPAAELRATSGVLEGRTVLVLGYGAIGRRLCALLAPFGAHVSALRERARGGEEVTIVEASRLDDAIEDADIIVSTLPESATTRGLMSRERIERMKRGAIFVNVGRGTTVDQDALTRAVLDGRLGGVGLDVTDPEPLPRDHPLWDAPRCVVTPHTAGGRADEHVRIVCHFLANLERFTRGELLIDRV